MIYTRKHELFLFILGTSGFLGLLLAGTFYAPGGVWLRGAALVWFLGFGVVRCLALVTLGHGGATEAETSSFDVNEETRSNARSVETALSSVESSKPLA